jgi:hypothetical protein
MAHLPANQGDANMTDPTMPAPVSPPEDTKVMSRPIPSLSDWLGDGARSDDFEAYVRDMLTLEYAVTDPNEESMVRMMRTLTIAAMECCRIECEVHDRSFADVLPLLARACGIGIMGPILSATREAPAAPLGYLVNLVTGEFRFGAERLMLAQEKRS